MTFNKECILSFAKLWNNSVLWFVSSRHSSSTKTMISGLKVTSNADAVYVLPGVRGVKHTISFKDLSQTPGTHSRAYPSFPPRRLNFHKRGVQGTHDRNLLRCITDLSCILGSPGIAGLAGMITLGSPCFDTPAKTDQCAILFFLP